MATGQEPRTPIGRSDLRCCSFVRAGELHSLERADEAPPADFERVSERFEAIKAKIQRSPDLHDDEAVQAKLESISGKFERLEGAQKEDAADALMLERETVEKEAAPADLEAVSDRFDAIKAKIQRDPELRKDKAIQAKLARISGKFERIEEAEEAKETEEVAEADAAPADLERDAAPADLERAEDRFEAMKAKIQASPELRKNKAIQAKLARISGKFERLEGAEEKEEEEAEEAAPADLEAVSDHFEAIKAKIQRDPELRKDKAIQAKLARISGKFERIEETEEAKETEEVAQADAAPADLERDDHFDAIKAEIESYLDHFDVIKAEIQSNPKLRGDEAIQAKLARISKEAAPADDDPLEVSGGPKHAPSSRADLEAVSDHFDAIKAKIQSNPKLRGDKAIQAKLARISGKFERLEGAEEKEEDEAEEAAPADLEAVSDRFEAIKAKIQSNPKLRGDKSIKAQLKRISGKFERLEGAEEEEEKEEEEEEEEEEVETVEEDAEEEAPQEEEEAEEETEVDEAEEEDMEQEAAPASNALMPEGLDQPEGLERVQKRFEAIKAKINKRGGLKSNPRIKAAMHRIGRKFKALEKEADEEA